MVIHFALLLGNGALCCSIASDKGVTRRFVAERNHGVLLPRLVNAALVS
jgi:hypothetical protein